MPTKLSVLFLTAILITSSLIIFDDSATDADVSSVVETGDCYVANDCSVPNDSVIRTNNVVIDKSNLATGCISISYSGDGDKCVRCIVSKDDYRNNYDLDLSGTPSVIALPYGNGDYTVKVYRHIEGTTYSRLATESITLALSEDKIFAPFIASTENINYQDSPKVVEKAAELVKGRFSDTEKVFAIYDFIVANINYDFELSANLNTPTSGVRPFYIADPDKTLESETGICLDYATLLAAMLRSQNIPCKLVYGYTEYGYHAWVEVYVKDGGMSDSGITLKPYTWNRLDPTFADAGLSAAYFSNNKNYQLARVF